MTLVELLVVAAILAAVSFIGYSNFGGVVDDSKEQVARAEMLEIAEAIRQFKQDTGYYPKQGPFGLYLPAAGYDGGVDPSSSQFPDQAGTTNSDRLAWFYSPANFWQLYECPRVTAGSWPQWIGCGDGSRQSWDVARGRGWRGPYLQGAREGYVNLSDDLDVTGHGSPIQLVMSTELDAVPGVADPFGQASDEYAGTLLDWRKVSDALPSDRTYLDHIGGAYFAFDLMDSTSNPAIDKPVATGFLLHPRIVSMGQDGRYGGRNATDPCAPGDEDLDGDDLVQCLR